ncbi:DNA primase [Atopococcus tabaci]|uniref:DNA primase n=1 Tax=Atopococcus tabaci TaxID=269774 RepID=UPI0003F66A11|nr:DNA primase [Atopococcus tabaci]
MWIPDETLERVRSQVNIVDVVSQFVQLKKQGKNLFGYCPFHDERTPSFSVREEKQLFHCFSCGRGGNVFTFLMELEGLSFPEAVLKVAELAAVEIDPAIQAQQQQQKPAADTKQGKLLNLYEWTSEFYHHILLNTTTGEEALNYLLERGLTRETIKQFRLGYSPPQRVALKQYLSGKADYENALLKESGLFSDRSDDELLDRFSNRIIFPIRNRQGQIIAFSGRKFLEGEGEQANIPKYLNSPETALFNKSTVLFNYDSARSSIRREGMVILFEGFMDVISAWQAGVKNGVASMGTSLTEEQIHLLDKVTDSIVIAYDGDTPGMEAAKRATDFLTEKSHFAVEVVLFPEKSDPDDYIKNKGPEAFKELLAHGRETLIGFLMRYHRLSLNLNNESDQLTYIEQILKEMIRVPSAIEREMYFQQLAEEFQLPIDTLKEQFHQYLQAFQRKRTQERKQEFDTQKQEAPVIPQVRKQVRSLNPLEKAERLLLYRLFHHPEILGKLHSQPEPFQFANEDSQLLFMLFESYAAEATEPRVDGFIDYIKERELKEKVTEIELMSVSEEFNDEEVEDCIKRINQASLYHQLEDSKKAMQEASRTGDLDTQRTLMMEIVKLTRQLKNN